MLSWFPNVFGAILRTLTHILCFPFENAEQSFGQPLAGLNKATDEGPHSTGKEIYGNINDGGSCGSYRKVCGTFRGGEVKDWHVKRNLYGRTKD